MDCGSGGVVVASPDLHYWSKAINAHLWNARFYTFTLNARWNEDFSNTGQYGTITAHIFDLQLFGFDGLLADSVELLFL